MDKLAVATPTKEAHEALFKLLKAKGYKWISGRDLESKPTKWDDYESNTVIFINRDNKKVTYSSVAEAKRHDTDLITAGHLEDYVMVVRVNPEDVVNFTEANPSLRWSSGKSLTDGIELADRILIVCKDNIVYWDDSPVSEALAIDYVPIELPSNATTPEHYALPDGTDVLDHLEGMFTPEMLAGFLVGNIYKYVTRYSKKNGVEDLEKARVYIDRLINVTSQGD